jgi:TetR/AcrR family transcriptional regulator
MTEIKTTDEIILEAARKVFARKGLEGARMQEIADEAGINKALLHYYYRSKEKMFELVFHEVLTQLFSDLTIMLTSRMPFIKKIEGFVDNYMDFLAAHPYLPGFIVTEIHRNPDSIISFMKSRNIPIHLVEKELKKEIKKGNVRNIDHRHLIVNLIALCVFPFIARPMLQGIFFKGEEEAFNGFLAERKEVLKDLIKQSLFLKI